MVIHNGYENLNIGLPVVTLGIFDGVHRGHMLLLEYLKKRAKELGGESVVLTFSPHPRMVLEKENVKLMFLSTPAEKKELLENAGIDHLVIVDFNIEFSRMPACDFVRDILVGKIGAKYLIVGYDHHFGRSGEGDYETIKQCSGLFDFRVEKVSGLLEKESAISSTSIREALTDGRLDEANKFLGYYYSLTGEIVEGRKIGRSIGFPTANIRPESHKLIPAKGVYAVEVKTAKGGWPGMLSIGTNPTVSPDGGKVSIEVNILNFEGDIYGENITVSFRKRLRDEMKFATLEDLARQMSFDKAETLKLFS